MTNMDDLRPLARRHSTNQAGIPARSSVNPSQFSTMTFNNQDTVLLRAETDTHVCFLHDNRIYIFKKKPSNDEDAMHFIIPNPNCDVEYAADLEERRDDESVEDLCFNLILHLMTTPKYRLLNSTYVVFTTLDHWIFVSIVVMLIVGYATQTHDDFSLSSFAWSLPITIAVMLEVFVGITMNTRCVIG